MIMVENIFRHLAHDDPAETANPNERLDDKLRRILNAAVEVDKPIFFSVVITIAAFLPLFTMQGVEGQIFGPMSRTYAYALIGAVIATFTVTPVMASILLPAHVQEVETILVRYIRKVYQFVLPRAVRHYRIAATTGLAFLLICGFLGARLGTEFLPKLEERKSVDPGAASAHHHPRGRDGYRRAHAQRDQELPAGAHGGVGTGPRRRRHRPGRVLRGGILRPAKAEGRMAERSDQGGDGQADEPAAETGIRRRRLQFLAIHPGQYEEAVSGVKGENSVKIFGRDLAELERLSKSLKTEIATVPGVTNPGGFNLLGQPNLIIKIDREKAARYGFSVADINSVCRRPSAARKSRGSTRAR